MASIVRPPPDETAQYTDPQTGRPSKDFFNWIRWLGRSVMVKPPGGSGSSGGASVLPAFSALKSVDQSIGNGVITQITFDLVVYNDGGYYAANVWKPPAGLVHLDAGFYATGMAAANSLSVIYITKNGPTAYYRQMLNDSVGASYSPSGISIDDRCNGSDVYGVAAYAQGTPVVAAGSTGPVSGQPVSTFFNGHWIGP